MSISHDPAQFLAKLFQILGGGAFVEGQWRNFPAYPFELSIDLIEFFTLLIDAMIRIIEEHDVPETAVPDIKIGDGWRPTNRGRRLAPRSL